jgi:hypothetical protein
MNVMSSVSRFGTWARMWVNTSHLLHHCRHVLSGGHHYNDPNLTAKEFLYAVMRDVSVPIADRVRAASALMSIEPDGPNHNQDDASMNQSAAVH